MAKKKPLLLHPLPHLLLRLHLLLTHLPPHLLLMTPASAPHGACAKRGGGVTRGGVRAVVALFNNKKPGGYQYDTSGGT